MKITIESDDLNEVKTLFAALGELLPHGSVTNFKDHDEDPKEPEEPLSIEEIEKEVFGPDTKSQPMFPDGEPDSKEKPSYQVDPQL